MCFNMPQQLLCKWESKEGKLLHSTALNIVLTKAWLSWQCEWGLWEYLGSVHSSLLSLVISAALEALYKIRMSWWYPYFQMSWETDFQKEELFQFLVAEQAAVQKCCSVSTWEAGLAAPQWFKSQARRDCWVILILTPVFHELLCFHLLLSAQATLCLTALPSAGRDPGFTWHLQEFKRFMLYFIACLRV